VQVPIVSTHRGITVVRDDLFPGGTKARYVGQAFAEADVVVYATPCEGGAQTALAHAARQLSGKRAVLVCAKRKVRHPRTIAAEQMGAEIIEVDGIARLHVVQARAREIATANGWYLAPFGLETPHAVAAIRAAALSIGIVPDEVWSVASSGVLARGLAAAWPYAHRHVVRIGREFSPLDVDFATAHEYGSNIRDTMTCDDFPSDPHYDAKAWSVCVNKCSKSGLVVFWNVAGPA
jgi:hypothetical protein